MTRAAEEGFTRTYNYGASDSPTSINTAITGAATSQLRSEEFSYGPGGLLEARTNDQAPRYPLNDRLGTLTGEVSDLGTVNLLPELDPFGVPASAAPALPEIDQKTLGFLGGAGREALPDSGLVKMGARMYDAETGAFISRDPVTGEAGEPARRVAYAYAFSGPGRYVDLDGRSALDGLCGPLFPAACGPSGNPNVTMSAEEAKDYYQSILDNPDSSDLARIVAKAGKVLSSVATCENFDDSLTLVLPIPGLGKLRAINKAIDRVRKVVGGSRGFDRAAFSTAGRAPAKGGLTAAGRSYQKHMDRGELPRVPGAELDRAGQSLLDGILSHPGSVMKEVTTGRARGGKRVIGPDGRSVTFRPDGSLAYFGRR